MYLCPICYRRSTGTFHQDFLQGNWGREKLLIMGAMPGKEGVGWWLRTEVGRAPQGDAKQSTMDNTHQYLKVSLLEIWMETDPWPLQTQSWVAWMASSGLSGGCWVDREQTAQLNLCNSLPGSSSRTSAKRGNIASSLAAHALRRRQLVLQVIARFIQALQTCRHVETFPLRPGRSGYAPTLLFHSPLSAGSWKRITCVQRYYY